MRRVRHYNNPQGSDATFYMPDPKTGKVLYLNEKFELCRNLKFLYVIDLGSKSFKNLPRTLMPTNITGFKFCWYLEMAHCGLEISI